jgi:hypothetical protein
MLPVNTLPQTIEGFWEDIVSQYGDLLTGRRVRVTILTDEKPIQAQDKFPQETPLKKPIS